MTEIRETVIAAIKAKEAEVKAARLEMGFGERDCWRPLYAEEIADVLLALPALVDGREGLSVSQSQPGCAEKEPQLQASEPSALESVLAKLGVVETIMVNKGWHRQAVGGYLTDAGLWLDRAMAELRSEIATASPHHAELGQASEPSGADSLRDALNELGGEAFHLATSAAPTNATWEQYARSRLKWLAGKLVDLGRQAASPHHAELGPGKTPSNSLCKSEGEG